MHDKQKHGTGDRASSSEPGHDGHTRAVVDASCAVMISSSGLAISMRDGDIVPTARSVSLHSASSTPRDAFPPHVPTVRTGTVQKQQHC